MPFPAAIAANRSDSVGRWRISEPTGRNHPVADETFATFHTTKGDIEVRLFPNHAPKTVANFVELAEGGKEWKDPRSGGKTTAKLYDGTIFHRVIEGFMIQGGDPLGSGRGGPGYQFTDEFHPELVFNRPYLLAMANAGPNTNGSQFFITVAATPHLNRKHTIFGEVTKGSDVVDAIATAPAGAGDKPRTDIVINSITVERRTV
jgi:peptidyl-prolyl cis-trans isomerase A (cyclophilin A)